MRILVATLVLSTISLSPAALACQCTKPEPPKKALAKSAAVFAGKVVEIERDGSKCEIKFQISRTWKGTKGKTVNLTTVCLSSCAFTFSKGKTYLVYCYKSKGKTTLTTNQCTRTKLLSKAKTDLKELGVGKKP